MSCVASGQARRQAAEPDDKQNIDEASEKAIKQGESGAAGVRAWYATNTKCVTPESYGRRHGKRFSWLAAIGARFTRAVYTVLCSCSPYVFRASVCVIYRIVAYERAITRYTMKWPDVCFRSVSLERRTGPAQLTACLQNNQLPTTPHSRHCVCV